MSTKTGLGFASLVGEAPQVGDGSLLRIEKMLSSSTTAMARLKDLDRFDEVFMPPIEVIIFQQLAACMHVFTMLTV